MLEPGCKMIKAIGIFVVLGFVFYIMKVVLLCYIFSTLATIMGIILWILIVVEGHQDKVLNEQAKQGKRKNYHND